MRQFQPTRLVAGAPLTRFSQKSQLYDFRRFLKDFSTALRDQILVTVGVLIVGLIPWIDNWAHLFGSIFGLLIAISGSNLIGQLTSNYNYPNYSNLPISRLSRRRSRSVDPAHRRYRTQHATNATWIDEYNYKYGGDADDDGSGIQSTRQRISVAYRTGTWQYDCPNGSVVVGIREKQV